MARRIVETRHKSPLFDVNQKDKVPPARPALHSEPGCGVVRIIAASRG